MEYRKISGYSKYAITRTGEVFEIESGDQILPNSPNKGRPRVRLYKDATGKKVQAYLCKLVAETYVLKPESLEGNDPAVEYKDGDKGNINASNLYWVPRNSNQKRNSPWNTDFRRIPNWSIDPTHNISISDSSLKRLYNKKNYG